MDLAKRDNLYALILAGGSGTRLWPLSRGLLPKHLLSLQGDETLLQQTARRLLAPVEKIPPERILTITHEDQLFEAKNQLQAVSKSLQRILAEPMANNTLPAIAWGVAEIAREDPNALVIGLPADHLIQKEGAFHLALDHALKVANENYLVTLGIRPTSPETGYGYIRGGPPIDALGARRVLSFVEKPDRDRALSYMQEGGTYWNAGIFAFKASLFMEELGQLEPEIFKSVIKIAEAAPEKKGSVVREEYSTMQPISIDYGILEKSKKVAVVPGEFGWSDLGSWQALFEETPKGLDRNVVQGDVLAIDTHDSLLISKKGLLATIGLEGVVVIQTDDAVLVSPLARSQEVKKIVELLKGKNSPLSETHLTVARPWGQYTILEEGPGCKIKRIVVNPGQKLSLQRHQHRAEHWVVIEGTAKVTNGSREIFLKENESTFIPQGERHRLENGGTVPLSIIEVQTGSYLGEDDIERFEDAYGRGPS